MYRRAICLLLLPCVLLAQSAVLGHSHGVGQPAGHDLRPHFHTEHASTRLKQAHHHHDRGCPHHHHDDGDDQAEPETPPTPQPGPLPESDHDSDAVFFHRTH